MKKSGILGAPEDLPIFGTYRFRLIKRGAYTAAEMNSQLVDLGDFTAPPHVWRASAFAASSLPRRLAGTNGRLANGPAIDARWIHAPLRLAGVRADKPPCPGIGPPSTPA